MSFKRFVNAVEVLALTAALATAVLLFANEPGEDAAASSPGGKIFTANCARCHGADGSGGIGPSLVGIAKTFPDIEDQIAVVSDGQAGMPAFKASLSDDEIRAVVEYTRTALGK
jgi:mono/diheme cytochrome c family protein